VIDGIFVFDNVIHVYDLSDANLRQDRPDARSARDHLLAQGRANRFPSSSEETDFAKRWQLEEIYQMVFVEGGTDMAMAQVVPLFDWYADLFAPVATQHAMAQRYPERVLFCGGVDPLYAGLENALAEIDRQIFELGARSMKFYNGHVDGSWRCDDREIAYPLYERCQANGVSVLQFHKGVPLGLQNVEDLRPNDLQGPARDFPELTFIIHHLALPYFDEALNIASRFPNVYLSLSGNIGYSIVAPRLVEEQLGRLLMHVGPEKLLWGSEAALLGNPRPYIERFLELTISEDLQNGYGYPEITREDKIAILGENFARLMKVDLKEKGRELGAASA
jgi:predicted TIM-barrel fold metal-dependent hydrolase